MLYTIGHSNHSFEAFLKLLQAEGVEAVADVRSMPMSRFNPQFNQKNLRQALQDAGLHYLFFGDSLGGHPRGPSGERFAHVPYDERVKMEGFQQGLQRLKTLAKEKRVAAMCAEKHPLNCHRALLVARALAEEDFPIRHILAGGTLITQEDLENALLRWTGQATPDLFFNRAQALSQAYRQRKGMGTYKPVAT
ncbi:MAG TPA: DUF488 domain-containing protein [Alphaproteobacteria bacterium]|nr:DUF488 domain-containing protein [Alphaproteobacteria bacterium]